MSLSSSRYTHLSYSGNYTPNASSFKTPFIKNKQLNQIFLDKKTIIKRMQTLMLDVKDLDTKMFISKTVSFLAQNLIEQIPPPFRPIDLNQNEDKENFQTKAKSYIFSNNFSEIKQFQAANSMEVSMMMPGNCESNIELVNDSKFFGETATSDGFFHSNTGFKHVEHQVIEQIVSQAGTVQCECGLLDWLLQMVSKLMEMGIVKNRQQEENQFLQIDETFIKEITQEIVESWKVLQEQQKLLDKKWQSVKIAEKSLKHQSEFSRNEMMKLTQNLVNKDSQNLQLHQKLAKLSQELGITVDEIQNGKALCRQWQDQCGKLKQMKHQIEEKLSVCLKNLQRSQASKSFLQESKNLQIESLHFQIELKDNQISNFQTIIESLQKRSRQYDSQIEGLKQIHNSSQQSISIAINYAIDLEQILQDINNSTEAIETNLNKQVTILPDLKQLKKLRLQNDLLKQQCILLYEKLNKAQLFGF